MAMSGSDAEVLGEGDGGCPYVGPVLEIQQVDVERMRARAQDRLMSKLASTRHAADEQRADAESKRDRSAARTAEQAEHIRRTGRMPSSLGCWNWCS